MSSGDNLIKAIKTRTITKEYLTYTEHDFHGGYEEYYLHKFKQFQSSIGRYLQNLRLKDMSNLTQGDKYVPYNRNNIRSINKSFNYKTFGAKIL